MDERIVRSRAAAFRKAMSYGPVGYVQAAIAGFIVACLLFLVFDAAVTQHNVIQELRLLLVISGTTAGAVLLSAIIANYIIGRRVLTESELHRKIFADGKLPPPTPCPDVPRIDLRPANDAAVARFRANEVS